MKRQIKVGSASQSIDVFIRDTSQADGRGLAGLAFNTSGLTAYYHRPGAASAAITLATLAAVTSAWSSGGFKEIDSTNMSGFYRLDLPDAVLAAGVQWVTVCLRGAANMAPVNIEIELVAYDPNDAAGLGLSRIDAAISSRSTYAGADTAGTTTLLSRIASAVTITGGKVDVNDKTGFSLSSAGIEAILKYDLSSVSGEAAKSLLNALRGQRNKTVLDYTALTFTVYKEDGATVAWAGTITVDAQGRLTGMTPSS